MAEDLRGFENLAGLGTDEQGRKYGLVFNFTNSRVDQVRSIAKGVAILKGLADRGVREGWRRKRERMVGEKVDVGDFLVEEVLRGKFLGYWVKRMRVKRKP